MHSLALSALSFSDPRDDSITSRHRKAVWGSRTVGVRLSFLVSAQKLLSQAAGVLHGPGQHAEPLTLVGLILQYLVRVFSVIQNCHLTESQTTLGLRSECEDGRDLPFIHSLPPHSPSAPERCHGFSSFTQKRLIKWINLQ